MDFDLDLDALTDLSEKGATIDGVRQTSERRLYMQLLVFGDCRGSVTLFRTLEESGFDCVLYKELNDPYGVGVLTMHEDPEFFVGEARHFFKEGLFSSLTPKPEYSMFGRTYAIGHERKLDDWLIDRSPRTVLNPAWPWAVYYPLKRKGEFSLLSREEQMGILMEHGMIGRAFGEKDYGHDIRLACHGLDANDNDFVIGLIGKDLHPLSALVQTMRATKQTSTYIERMGPFFVGKVAWQSKIKTG
jgi:chlorite dismutase